MEYLQKLPIELVAFITATFVVVVICIIAQSAGNGRELQKANMYFLMNRELQTQFDMTLLEVKKSFIKEEIIRRKLVSFLATKTNRTVSGIYVHPDWIDTMEGIVEDWDKDGIPDKEWIFRPDGSLGSHKFEFGLIQITVHKTHRMVCFAREEGRIYEPIMTFYIAPAGV